MRRGTPKTDSEKALFEAVEAGTPTRNATVVAVWQNCSGYDPKCNNANRDEALERLDLLTGGRSRGVFSSRVPCSSNRRGRAFHLSATFVSTEFDGCVPPQVYSNVD